ncbi:MAG: polysaccharide ABC transporter ATP-binding protein [Cytophagales bacterium]|nr:polysaccharide ABC transporter ATP-binding protein [Cytophagales bacterium]
MSNTVIRVENLGKLYRIGEIGTGTLSHDLNRFWAQLRGKEDPYSKVGTVNDRTQQAQRDEHVWALKDISFEVQQGEVLGVIGKNGAGKSTLLKLLSRVTSPTYGEVKIKGRVASLLEVGTGFHLEMTGRENIYMNGTIMGMRRQEIAAKLDDIVDFAGVAKYLDTPVKRYSSGMTVRLGFAIAAFLEPEILIVDEVLAVGDTEFQKRAIGKIQDVSKGESRTVLFVSHNLNSIRKLCNTGIYLRDGKLAYVGSIDGALESYGMDYKANDQNRGGIVSQHSSREIFVKSLRIFNRLGQEADVFLILETILFDLEIESIIDDDDVDVAITIDDPEGNRVLTLWSKYSDTIFKINKGRTRFKVHVPRIKLIEGDYYVGTHIGKKGKVFERIDFLRQISIRHNPTEQFQNIVKSSFGPYLEEFKIIMQ